MTHQWMTKIPKVLGVSQTSLQIYIALTIQGPQQRKELVETLGMEKTQVNNSLKRLQSKGLVYMSLGRPVTFYAVSLDQALNSVLEKDNKQVESLERNREAILSYWRNLTSNR